MCLQLTIKEGRGVGYVKEGKRDLEVDYVKEGKREVDYIKEGKRQPEVDYIKEGRTVDYIKED